MTPISAHVESFVVARTYAPASAKQRRTILRRFCRQVGDPAASDLTPGRVLDWWQSTGDLSSSSRAAHLSAVRTFLGYLVSANVLESDPSVFIVRPRVHRVPPVVLTERQILDVLKCAATARDQAIVALMLGCALRSSDVAALRVEEIDLAGQTLMVVGKGDVPRLVPMPSATVACVAELMRRVPSTGPLVRSLRGPGGVRPSTVRSAVVKVLRAAGVKQAPWDRRSSHVLRRTCATVLLESGATVSDVQEILGHASLATTQVYLARPDVRRLVEVVESGPLARAA